MNHSENDSQIIHSICVLFPYNKNITNKTCAGERKIKEVVPVNKEREQQHVFSLFFLKKLAVVAKLQHAFSPSIKRRTKFSTTFYISTWLKIHLHKLIFHTQFINIKMNF